MEIDFQKIDRVKSGNYNYAKKQSAGRGFSRKLALGISALMITFTVGLISGMSLGSFQNLTMPSGMQTQMPTELVTPNVSTQQTLSDNVKVSSNENSPAPLPNVVVEAETNTQAQGTEKKPSVEELSSYLILANIYESQNSAHSAGLTLQKENIPVFLAASGAKMKLYVGPVEGEKNARNLLSRIKKMPEFRGAILYKK